MMFLLKRKKESALLEIIKKSRWIDHILRQEGLSLTLLEDSMVGRTEQG